MQILEGMQVFGHDHAPHGHMHIKFDNVWVPKENILLGEGRGFEFLGQTWPVGPPPHEDHR